MTGTIDHSDSIGNCGQYGDGDLQYMTAGRGAGVRGEMFPLRHADKPNTLQLFQIWLNLPSKDKMVEPAFVMHWSEDVKRKEYDGVEFTVWTGEYGRVKARTNAELLGRERRERCRRVLGKNASRGEVSVERRERRQVDGPNALLCRRTLIGRLRTMFSSKRQCSRLTLSKIIPLENKSASEEAIVLVLQGKPIDEPVAQHGPFVMNTHDEISQAFADYRSTRLEWMAVG